MPANGPADDRTPLLLLLVLGVVLAFVNLGGTDLWNPDEPRYAQVAREMVAAADPAAWLVPRLNGAIYDQKPPAFFWTVGAFGLAVGRVDEWAARLPAACCSVLTLFFTYLFGARLFGRRAGLLGAVVLATSLLFVVMARKAAIDAPLTLQVLLSLMFLEEGVRWPERRGRAWCAAFFFMGVGALLKGVGFVLPLLALVAYLALARNLRPLASGGLVLGLLVALAVAGAWGAAAAHVAGPDYVRDLLFGQLRRRFAESGGHDRGPGYYLLHFPWGFWPWILFLPSLVVFLARGWFDRRVPRFAELIAGDHSAEEAQVKVAERASSWLFLAAWFGTTFLFFTLVPSKREIYLLPAYPAAALAVGAFLSWAFDRPDPGPTLAGGPFYALCWVHGFLGVALASAAVMAPRLAAGLPWLHPYAEFVPPLRWPVCAVALALALAMFVAALAWRAGRRAGALAAVAVGAAAVTAGAALFVLPLLNPWKSARDVCDGIRQAHPAPGKVAWLGSLDESFLFYLDRPIEVIPLREPDAAKRRESPGIPATSVVRIQELLDGAPRAVFLIEPKHVGAVKEAVAGSWHRLTFDRDPARAGDRARRGGADPADRKVQVWANRPP